jgi:hypothetical protein
MLALHSDKERNETGWATLVDKVEGMQIRKFWRSPDQNGEDIVEIGMIEILRGTG